MTDKKLCNVRDCDAWTNLRLDDLWEIDWIAFQAPAGKGAILYYCPKHKEEGKKDMNEVLKNKINTQTMKK